MKRQMQAHDLHYQFIDAIDGRNQDIHKLAPTYNQKMALGVLGRGLSAPEAACLLSHWHIYSRMLDSDQEYALVLEDDIDIIRPIQSILRNIDKLPNGWHIAMLSYYRSITTSRFYTLSLRCQHKIDMHYRAMHFTDSMHSSAAYLISKKGALYLANIFSDSFFMPIDHYIGSIRTPGLYAVSPKPIEINLKIGFETSALANERAMHSQQASQTKSLKLRSIAKKIRIFGLLKALNLLRLSLQRPLTGIMYTLFHSDKLFYRSSSWESD
jgi:GR25 family glycosyltransferase involved in LPS biosynthesis